MTTLQSDSFTVVLLSLLLKEIYYQYNYDNLFGAIGFVSVLGLAAGGILLVSSSSSNNVNLKVCWAAAEEELWNPMSRCCNRSSSAFLAGSWLEPSSSSYKHVVSSSRRWVLFHTILPSLSESSVLIDLALCLLSLPYLRRERERENNVQKSLCIHATWKHFKWKNTSYIVCLFLTG